MVKIEVDVNYRIINLKAGTYLTLDSKDNVSIIGQEYINKSNQVWMFESSGHDNIYFIKSVETNQYLAVPIGQIVAGQQLKANFAPFEWHVVDQPNMAIAARVKLTTKTGLYVDLYDASANDGTPVRLWGRAGFNHVWVLLRD